MSCLHLEVHVPEQVKMVWPAHVACTLVPLMYQRNPLNQFSHLKVIQRIYLALDPLLPWFHHSSLPFREGPCLPFHTAPVASYTWLLVVEPNLAYALYQYSMGKYTYLGNTLVSIFSYVHGDISPKYILGTPQGWSLGRGPVFFLQTWMGGTIPSPAVQFTTYVAQTADTLQTARLLPQESLRSFDPLFSWDFFFFLEISFISLMHQVYGKLSGTGIALRTEGSRASTCYKPYKYSLILKFNIVLV